MSSSAFLISFLYFFMLKEKFNLISKIAKGREIAVYKRKSNFLSIIKYIIKAVY